MPIYKNQPLFLFNQAEIEIFNYNGPTKNTSMLTSHVTTCGIELQSRKFMCTL